jgi:hypothetical protein
VARNGSGTYSAPSNSFNPAVANTTISKTDWNAVLDDIETALTESIARDGQTTTSAIIPFASGVKTDTIAENSTNTGVTIDGVLLKDGGFVVNESGADVDSRIEGDTDANLFYTDAGNDRVGIGTASPTEKLEVASTDAGAGEAPVFSLYRDSATPAASDVLGAVVFKGEDSAGNSQAYARVRAVIADPTSTSEDGQLTLRTVVAGTEADRVIVGQGVQIGSAPLGGDPGTGKANATDFQIAGASVLAAFRGHLGGLTLSNGTDATNDIDIAVGSAAADDQSALLVLSSALTKQLDAAWAVGTNQGGLDTGSIANDVYHVFLIRRSDTGVVDALFSASASSPTMPANYDQKRRIGSFERTGGAIRLFTQRGDEFLLLDPPLPVDSTNPGVSAVSRTLTGVPDGIVVEAKINAVVIDSAQSGVGYLSPLDVNDEAASSTAGPLGQITWPNTGGSVIAAWSGAIRTNTSSQIRSRLSTSGASTILRIATLGWIDRRGKDD